MSLTTHVEMITQQSMADELQEAAEQAAAYLTQDLRNEAGSLLRHNKGIDSSAHSESLLNNTVFVTTGMGARPYQEDRYGVSLVQNFPAGLSSTHIGQLLFLTINKMGHHLKDETDGSTLTAALIHEEHIYTANVGDSRALAICETVPNQYEITPLSVDHKPGYPPERSRLESEGHRVITHGVPRLNGELAVSRALGDNYYRQHGLLHTPGVSCFPLPKCVHSYLLLLTDGISDVISSLELSQFFANNPHPFKQNPADKLRHQAFQNGSTDNMTGLLVEITADTPTLLCFVADGHGGDLASQSINEQLGPRFQRLVDDFHSP
jgi:serine/threonine protein phosphatase PrpC